jgi:transcriptional regulator with XRE-family HTH domain
MTTKQIGASIRKARGPRSIREVAASAGLSRHQVTSIEQATTNYTIQSLLALAKVVGVPIKANP